MQVHRNTEIPSRQEVTVVGKVPEDMKDASGVIEGGNEPILLATTVNKPDKKAWYSCGASTQLIRRGT